MLTLSTDSMGITGTLEDGPDNSYERYCKPREKRYQCCLRIVGDVMRTKSTK